MRILPFLAAAALLAAPLSARTILFVGNSFTFGDKSPVRRFHPERVHDLNHEAQGGVPALFATFAKEAGLDYDVSLETSPGKPLSFHVEQKRDVIAGKWDVVILQGYSTLDPEHPGDSTRHIASARDLTRLFRSFNPAVTVDLNATWSRADQTYPAQGHWSGKPIAAMADDLAAASRLALVGPDHVDAIIPVGMAWKRAMESGLADPNPYDGIAFGQIDLWSWDHYHASSEGYYLEALVIFGKVTGVDPRTLGDAESAAADLGLNPVTTKALQAVAAAELAAGR